MKTGMWSGRFERMPPYSMVQDGLPTYRGLTIGRINRARTSPPRERGKMAEIKLIKELCESIRKNKERRGKMQKKKTEKTKEQRAKSENTRLKKQYKELPDEKKAIAEGLFEQAAFLRVELEDLAADIRENGWTEPFQQAKGMEPYQRARPAGQAYQSSVANYQKIIKLLDSLLPPAAPKTKSDGFDEFIREREGS